MVSEINQRTGAQLQAKAVAKVNTGVKNGVENSCGLDSFRDMFNESTLHSIGLQYSRDVIKFGYL